LFGSASALCSVVHRDRASVRAKVLEKIAGRLQIGGRGDRLLLRLALPETFIVKKKNSLSSYRSAERAAELIAFSRRFCPTVGEELVAFNCRCANIRTDAVNSFIPIC